MASFTALTASKVARRSLSSALARRSIHQTSARYAITNFEMPAMSPTMTEGGIASWKKSDGESFIAGDVLVEIETDKATIDVEAQDDGIMGKILLPDGSKNVPVGKIIALLAEEGDDISNLEAPKEQPSTSKQQEASSSSSKSSAEEPAKSIPEVPTPEPSQSHDSTPPTHSRPLFPSVHRLLQEYNVSNAEQIKGTGVRGMLTKGDVLAFLGKASGPTGTFKESPSPIQEATKSTGKKEEVQVPLDGAAIRRIIVSSMLQSSIKARNATPAPLFSPDADSVIADYLTVELKPQPLSAVQPPRKTKESAGYLDGLI